MATVAELLQLRERLTKTRYGGTRIVETDGRKVEYRSDAELARAISALDAEIAAAGGANRVSVVQINSSKGV
jgi:hypothetical protein